MDIENLTSWISQPDVCRCCLSTGGTWDLTDSYTTEAGIKEVYSDMLQECFGIALSNLSEWGSSHLVCNLCVTHLRDACSFRKQVQEAEKLFVDYSDIKRDELKVKEENPLQTELPSPDHLADTRGESDDKDTLQDIEQTIIKKHKTKIKKNKKQKSIDYDSDTPIAELTRHRDVEQKVSLQQNGGIHQNESYNNTKGNITENLTYNNVLRNNVTLILKYSTITPFKHINKNKYICLYCNEAYLYFNQLKEHVNVAHSDVTEAFIKSSLKTPRDLVKADVSLIKCKICEASFKNIEILIEHLIKEHNKNYKNTPEIPSNGILGFNLSSDKLKCHICDAEFRFFKNLSVHMNEHSTNFMCHVCGKKFVSDHRLQTHVSIHRQKQLKCKQCGLDFRTSSARSYHIRKVHNGKFKCPECCQSFSQYLHRLKHLIECHDFKKPLFKCYLCFKEFASSSGVSAHLRYSHTKNDQYSCDICGKIFIYKWILKRHMDVHTGVKNFECKYCKKKFSKSYTLQVHVRIHLNDKRFGCNLCKAAFVQKCSLNNHLRVHHPDCDINK